MLLGDIHGWEVPEGGLGGGPGGVSKNPPEPGGGPAGGDPCFDREPTVVDVEDIEEVEVTEEGVGDVTSFLFLGRFGESSSPLSLSRRNLLLRLCGCSSGIGNSNRVFGMIMLINPLALGGKDRGKSRLNR